jgi:hypothetical protein
MLSILDIMRVYRRVSISHEIKSPCILAKKFVWGCISPLMEEASKLGEACMNKDGSSIA